MTAKGWLDKINKAEKAHKSWLEDAKECWKRYTGETKQHFNIFKSNTDILQGALFNVMPKPDIRERFSGRTSQDDKKQNLYLSVATVADRCVQYNNDATESKKSISKMVKDGHITGRGVVYIEYDYDDLGEAVENQTIPVEHIPYNLYIEEVCDREKEISWKGHQIPMTKKECAKEFEVKEEDLGTSLKVEDVDGASKDFVKVYEIWSEKSKTRIYVSPDYKEDKILREDKDPLGLKKFFPYEKYKTIDNGKNTLPTPEYNIYKKLNEDLQDMTRRKSKISNNDVKYRPMFDNSAGEDLKNSYSAIEGDAVPVVGNPQVKILDRVGALPTIEAQNIVAFLSVQAQEVVENIWQVTGISDILRGDSDARETATAQKMKGVFGSLRIQPRQEAIQEIIKCIFRKQSEVVCEKFTTEEMQTISCMDLPTAEEKMQIQQRGQMTSNPQYQQAVQQGLAQPVPQPTPDEMEKLKQPTMDEVVKVLRDDKMRGYTIDIETTATIFDDLETQREQLMQFTTTLFNMMQQTAQFVAASPSVIDLMEQMTLLNVSQFKVSRGYIDSIKTTFTKIKAEVEAPKEQAPDPAMIKAKLDQSKMQQDQANKQQENQIKMMEMQGKDKELQIKTMQEDKKLALESQKVQDNSVKVQNDTMKTQADISYDQQILGLKQQEENRRMQELVEETKIAQAEILTGIEAPTIAGDVSSVR